MHLHWIELPANAADDRLGDGEQVVAVDVVLQRVGNFGGVMSVTRKIGVS